MKRYHLLYIAAASALAVILWHQFPKGDKLTASSARAYTSKVSEEPIQPISPDSERDEKRVRLGKQLFNERQLSHDNTVSCASCHNLALGGVDHRPSAVGINGAVGPINAPTVFNSEVNFKQFWDGRAETLEDQIDGPIQSPIEMGSTWPEVIEKLRRSPDYVLAFNAVYSDGIQPHNIKDAIAAFERSLDTPDSRFDRYLHGDQGALSDEEKHGYQIFKSYGCVSCHQGTGVGGNMFQTFGVMADYFADRGKITKADLGRYNATGDESDRYSFKVPSLRNVELTAPYFHDGSAGTLNKAVEVMGKYQLGRRLSPQEVDSLVRFLKTLTGEYRDE